VHTARFSLRQNFAQSFEGRGVGMPDSDSFSLFLRATESQFELLVHRWDLRDIVEEGDIAEGGRHSQALGGVVGDGRGSRSAVDIKEIPFLKDGHQFFHERGIGSGF